MFFGNMTTIHDYITTIIRLVFVSCLCSLFDALYNHLFIKLRQEWSKLRLTMPVGYKHLKESTRINGMFHDCSGHHRTNPNPMHHFLQKLTWNPKREVCFKWVSFSKKGSFQVHIHLKRCYFLFCKKYVSGYPGSSYITTLPYIASQLKHPRLCVLFFR